MNLRRATTEALRNARSRPVLTTLLIVVAFAAGSTAATWSLSTSTRIQADWERHIAEGVWVSRVVGVNGAPLDAAQCDALGRISTVRASGAIMQQEFLVATVGGAAVPVTVQSVTPGFLAIAYPEEAGVRSAGSVAGIALSGRLGLRDGDTVRLGSRLSESADEAPVDRAATSPSRMSGSDGALMIARPPRGVVNECLVEIQPGTAEATLAAVLGSFDGHGVAIGDFVPADGTRGDPLRDLAGRPTRLAGAAAGGVAVAALIATWWFRRAELALYRRMGLRRRVLLHMAAVESTLLTAVPYCAGVWAAVVAGSHRMGPAALATAPWELGMALPLCALAPWTVLVWVRSRQSWTILRENG